MAGKKGKVDKKADKNFPPPSSCVPPDVKVSPRVPRPDTQFEESTPEQLQKNFYSEFDVCEAWPGQAEAESFDFGVTSNKEFESGATLVNPPSTQDNSKLVIVNKRLSSLFKNFEVRDPDRLPSQLQRQPTVDVERDIILDLPAKNFHPFENGSPESHIDESDFEYDDNEELMIKVCHYDIRDETPEEQAIRIKKEETSKPKKKDKKKWGATAADSGEATTVKEPIMSNVTVGKHLSKFARWVASLLQVIVEQHIQDSETGNSILCNIYPQEEGVPVYNPSGRYWVKLYALGSARKVEIDDIVPVDALTRKPLLPTANNMSVIWPILLSKAVHQLFGYFWQRETPTFEFGEGIVMYALTGLSPCTIRTQDLQQEWSLLNDLLSDKKYDQGSCYIVAYSSSNFKPTCESNTLPTREATKLMIKNNLSIIPPGRTPRNDISSILLEEDEVEAKETRELQQLQDPQSQRSSYHQTSKDVKQIEDPIIEIPHNVQTGVAYSLRDFFENGKFNMVFTQAIPTSEIKLRAEFVSISKENNGKQSKEDLHAIRSRKKLLRNKIRSINKKRQEMMEKDPPPFYRLVKLSSGLQNQKPLQMLSPFNSKEIYTAKTCIMNNMPRPPNYCDFYESGDNKSIISGQVSNSKQNNAQDEFLEQAKKNLADFARVPHAKKPVDRETEGLWVLDSDLLRCFEFIQVYFNPKAYKENTAIFNQSSSRRINNFSLENQVLVLSELAEDYEEYEIQENEEGEEVEKVVVKQRKSNDKIEFILGFNPSGYKELSTLSPFCILQKFDFDVRSLSFYYF